MYFKVHVSTFSKMSFFLKLRVLHEIDTLSATERIATRVSLFVHVITIIRIAYINIINFIYSYSVVQHLSSRF